MGIDTTLNEKVELYCLGGFVITVLYNLARPTADVDVIAITPRSEIEISIELSGSRFGPSPEAQGISSACWCGYRARQL
jgi:hypothetical protein